MHMHSKQSLRVSPVTSFLYQSSTVHNSLNDYMTQNILSVGLLVYNGKAKAALHISVKKKKKNHRLVSYKLEARL